ncbi:MAG: hypothetical protein ABSE62_01030 [Chthoniobacteraceae bacterium]
MKRSQIVILLVVVIFDLVFIVWYMTRRGPRVEPSSSSPAPTVSFRAMSMPAAGGTGD